MDSELIDFNAHVSETVEVNMFVILIGSVAKKQQNINSDIDIVRIETYENVQRLADWPDGPINYIDYTYEDFVNLYNNGSLFIYHIFSEGLVLRGDPSKWSELKRKFIFNDNLDSEISDIRLILKEYLDEKIYGNIYLSFYSNIFTLLKNYSIYSLAKKGIFEFNKEKAFKSFFGQPYYDLLSECYNRFERGCLIPSKTWDLEDSSLAKNVIHYFKAKMEDCNAYARDDK